MKALPCNPASRPAGGFAPPLRLCMALFVLLLVASTAGLQAAYPLVHNYDRIDYHAGAQNWAVSQDNLGRMLIANSTGLLVYDSKDWTLLQLSNYTTVRSIYFDEKSHRIYVGGSEEFGFFAASPDSGLIKYHSLVDTMDPADRHFSEIWNIHHAGGYIWFQGDYTIFRFDGKNTIAIPYPHKINTSALVNDRLFIASEQGGISILNGSEFTAIPGNEIMLHKHVAAILPYNRGNVLFVTAFDGIFIYDGVTVRPYPTDIDHFLKENQVFCAATNEKDLVFGTVNRGIVIKDIANGTNTFVNTKNGMQNNTVLSISFDKLDNIWLGLDNGIDYVLYNSPITTVFDTWNMYGTGYTSMLFGKTLLLGTNQGLYAAPYPIPSSPEPAVLTPVMKSQVWSIDTIAGTILVGNDRGLFQIVGHKPIRIDSIPGTWSVVPLKQHKGYALVSTYENFFIIRQENGRWENVGRVKGYNDAGGRIIEDDLGNIWMSHWMKGIFRFRLDKGFDRFSEVKLYNSTNKLPTDRNSTLCVIDGEMVISTEGGFFRYDNRNDRMIPDKRLNTIFGQPGAAVRLYQSPSKDVWALSDNRICAAFYNASGSYNIDSITYKPLLEKLVIGFEDFNFTAARSLIVSNEDGFYEINIDREHKVNWKSDLFISKVYITGNPDSLIYTPTGKRDQLVLPFKSNSLRFEFICPEFREKEAVEYSYYLENYDKGWSAYSPSNSKEYTKLHEGYYTLHIRSFNRYDGSRMESSFSFRISPPWYRSIWAILAYLVVLCIIGRLLYRLLKYKSHKAAAAVARRKEAEIEEFKRKAKEESLRRENEIEKLKSEQLEHDIRHKSQELSSTTMNVIRKNEILIDISQQINKIQESDDSASFNPSTKKQLARIQSMIKENISHDDDWQKFAQNFDIVYENYLKRLVALYPQLNANDQRLCAYLKMGLSSKEIAPLLNMSYRSVEMTRYRLRKKMGLSRETNLSDYLQRI